jgi:enamine deaminase RidA (YjgF/YER057c/UK114 family)
MWDDDCCVHDVAGDVSGNRDVTGAIPGSGLDRMVDMTTYHVDMHEHIDAFIQVKSEYVPNLPSWTAVGDGG